MENTDESAVDRLLGGLVPDELLTAYKKLRACDGCDADKAEDLLGSPYIMDALNRWGLGLHLPYTATRPRRFDPAPPDQALVSVVMHLRNSLDEMSSQLVNAHDRLADQYRVIGADGGAAPAHLVSVLTDPSEISRRHCSLALAARNDYMTLDNLMYDMEMDEAFAESAVQVIEDKQVRRRSIYESAYMERDNTRRVVELGIEAGEEVRLYPRLPMRVKMADESAAFVALTPTGAHGAMLVKSPTIVRALRQYFELLWENAIPVGDRRTGPGGLTEAERDTLLLLAEGLGHQAIARRLRRSERTVSRNVGTIMARLNADTPFAAGVAACRRGWLG